MAQASSRDQLLQLLAAGSGTTETAAFFAALESADVLTLRHDDDLPVEGEPVHHVGGTEKFQLSSVLTPSGEAVPFWLSSDDMHQSLGALGLGEPQHMELRSPSFFDIAVGKNLVLNPGLDSSRVFAPSEVLQFAIPESMRIIKDAIEPGGEIEPADADPTVPPILDDVVKAPVVLDEPPDTSPVAPPPPSSRPVAPKSSAVPTTAETDSSPPSLLPTDDAHAYTHADLQEALQQLASGSGSVTVESVAAVLVTGNVFSPAVDPPGDDVGQPSPWSGADNKGRKAMLAFSDAKRMVAWINKAIPADERSTNWLLLTGAEFLECTRRQAPQMLLIDPAETRLSFNADDIKTLQDALQPELERNGVVLVPQDDDTKIVQVAKVPEAAGELSDEERSHNETRLASMIEEAGDNPQALFNAINEAMSAGLFAYLDEATLRLMKIDDIPERGLVIRSLVLRNTNRAPEAESLLRSFLDRNGPQEDVLVNLAMVLDEQGNRDDHDEVEQRLQEALKLNPRHHSAGKLLTDFRKRRRSA